MISKYIKIPCNECGKPKRVINGQYLKQQRENAQLSQREFGRLVNMSSPHLSDIERNRRECPEDVVQAYLLLLITKQKVK